MKPLATNAIAAITVAFAMVAAPHAERLPWWLTAIALAMCVWRIHIARTRGALPARWLIILIVCATAASIYLHYRTLFGRDAGVALLTLMMSLKLMETRTERDGMVLIYIGYFLVLTNFFHGQSILVALYLLACVWVLTAVMVRLQHASDPPPLRQTLRASGLMLAQSLPLMVVLFVLFPRIQGPLWGMPSDAFAGSSGLSDSMSPGTLSKLVLSDELAFRAEFEGAIPLPNRLYWRGPVLSEYDGRTWTAMSSPLRSNVTLARADNLVNYAITLEPHTRRWIFALDMPTRLAPRAMLNGENQMLSPTLITSRTRYELQAALDYDWGTDIDRFTLQRAMRLPAGFNPRTVELGGKLRDQYGSQQAIVDGALKFLREQNYTYTLEPPLLGRDAADDFLFNTRAGFCEHYASAFVILMRAAGVPARVVTGYLGGDYNPLGNYLMVRQSEAHAWSEVWINERGWVRVDPTYAVSPQRADNGITASLPQGSLLPSAMRGARGEWLRQMALTWDSIANRWNQTVLGYNLESQRALLYRAGLTGDVISTLAHLLIWATAIVTLMLALLTLRARRRNADPVADAYALYCRKLARAGLARGDSEGPADYLTRVANARPDLASATQAITQLYVSLRYEEYKDHEKLNKNNNLHTFRQIIKQFHPART